MNVLGFAIGNGAEGDVRIYFFEKRSMVLVVIQYSQMSCLNTHTDIFNGARALKFSLDYDLHPYFVYGSNEGSGKSVNLPRLLCLWEQ